MAFFNICPRNKKYLDYAFKDIPLRVIYNNGVTVTPDFDVNVTDLNNGYKHFKVNNGKGDTFKLQVLIHRDDIVQGHRHYVVRESARNYNLKNVKMVNVNEQPCPITLNVTGVDLLSEAEVISLKSDNPQAMNTIDQPELVVPKTEKLTLGVDRTIVLPASSLTVVKIGLR